MNSRINFDNGDSVTFYMDADLVHLSDEDYRFVMEIISKMRRFEKARQCRVKLAGPKAVVTGK